MNYNYFQHSNPSTTSSNPHTSSAFEPILLSLLCGLPNEVDFIINTLIHLSADDKNPLKMAECPRIVDALLAHVGFFGSNDKYQLRNLYDSVWNSKDDEHDPDSTRSRLIEKYATYGYSDFVDEYMGGLKKTKRRCFVLFWHNGVRLPDVGEDLSPDINNLPPLLENILPKLYNNGTFHKSTISGVFRILLSPFRYLPTAVPGTVKHPRRRPRPQYRVPPPRTNHDRLEQLVIRRLERRFHG